MESDFYGVSFGGEANVLEFQNYCSDNCTTL